MNLNKIKNIEHLKSIYEDEPYLTAAGLFFGFPQCCIESFVNREQFEVIDSYPDLPSHGTGYVPCMKCAPKVEDNWEDFQKKINSLRFSRMMFPKEGQHRSLDKFFIKFTSFIGHDPKAMALSLRNSENILKLIKKP